MCIVFSTCALHSVSSHLFLGKNMNDSLTGSKGGGYAAYIEITYDLFKFESLIYTLMMWKCRIVCVYVAA